MKSILKQLWFPIMLLTVALVVTVINPAINSPYEIGWIFALFCISLMAFLLFLVGIAIQERGEPGKDR